MNKLYILVLLITCNWIKVSAQDQRVFSQFFINPYIYNPAYAGVEGHTAIFALYRSQWIGINGAPQLGHVNFHTPLKNNMAIGALAYNESVGPLKTSGAKATVGYLVELDQKHFVRFGLSFGGGYTSYDPSVIAQDLDPVFQNLSSNSFINADFGVAYHFDHFNVGVSLPNLLGRKVISSESFSPVTLRPVDNIMFQVNYRGHINDNFAIEPHLIYRFSTVNMPQYEANVILHIKHIIWTGAGYRQDAGFTGLFGFKIKEQWAVGLSYGLGNSDISSVSSGTAEVHIGFHLGDRKHHHGHSHSFIKSFVKTKEQKEKEEERARLLAERRKATADALAEKSRLEKEAADAKVAQEAKQVKASEEQKLETETQVASNAKIDDSVPMKGRIEKGVREISATYIVTNPDGTTTVEERWYPIPVAPRNGKIDIKTPLQERTNKEGVREIGTTFLITGADGKVTKQVVWTTAPKVAEKSFTSQLPDQQNTKPADNIIVDSTKTQETTNSDASAAQKHLMISPGKARKGNHILELPVGHHVVAAQFKNFQDAEDYSDKLFERGFQGTIVGYVSAVGEYFVVVHKGASMEQALAEQAKWKKLKDLDHVYIFNVVE